MFISVNMMFSSYKHCSQEGALPDARNTAAVYFSVSQLFVINSYGSLE